MKRVTVQEILDLAVKINKDYPELSYKECIDKAIKISGQIGQVDEGRGQA